ncbi:MAG: hypothetical protein DMG39_27815 [Acidobacteria bacterium]|nr:MAG: hypothetical protein DMG39_27815 [Acidobacteriota bacterium]
MMRGSRERVTRRPELPRAIRKCRGSRMTSRVTRWILVPVLGLGVGCGAARPSKYYQLTVPGDVAPSVDQNPIPITLLIGRLTGPALYHEDQIVYSSGGESMGTYEYHRWAEPPTEMIAEIMLRQLRASGHYRGVYTLRSDMQGDFLLHGRLYDFKEISGSSIVGRVTMELELRNIKAGNTVWTHFYSHDQPAEGKDVGALVAALDKNVQQGVAECRASLDEYFASHPPAPTAPNAR